MNPFYKPKILIVDDNLENLKVVGNILKAENYDIAVSTGGESAINILINNEIDLILMDIMMPEVDGLETCRRIKKIDTIKDIPLIFLTAKAQTSDILEAFEAGGVDYIFKPFNRLELKARVQTHLDLFLSKRKLKELYQNRDLIYSIIAHDIKDPFNKITQFLQLVQSGAIDPSSADFIELLKLINEETSKTSNLIYELIEWGKLITNKERAQLEPVVIRPISDTVITFLESTSKLKLLTIDNAIPEDVLVNGNAKSLEVIFRNLLANAIKYTPEGGTITFTFEDVGQKVKIGLQDTGVGMTEAVVDKIFNSNQFYTTPGTNKENGSGLGIQIIKDLVKQNKAELEIKSVPSLGTTIELIIEKVA